MGQAVTELIIMSFELLCRIIRATSLRDTKSTVSMTLIQPSRNSASIRSTELAGGAGHPNDAPNTRDSTSRRRSFFYLGRNFNFTFDHLLSSQYIEINLGLSYRALT